MEEWKEYRLGDICDTISDTYKGNSPQVILINTSDVLEGKCLNHIPVPNKNLKGQFKKTFCNEDILYSEIRPANKRFAYIDFEPKDYIASTKLMVIRSKKEVLPKYLYYILQSNQMLDKLQTLAETRSGTFPQITFSELAAQKIILPGLNSQKKIVQVLESINSKIELNRRINENLEQQAQALFKSWFIDFRPFKDGKFVDSELGMIPEGWKVVNLLNIAELYDSFRRPLSSRDRAPMEKLYPYYGATSVMDYVDNYIFDGIYLLMGEDGSVINEKGYPYLQYVFGKFWPNNHAHVMQGKNGFTTEMLHCFLLKKNISGIVTGAVQAKISQQSMKKILLAIPNENLCGEFACLIVPIYANIRNIINENRILSQLRDTLLPRLMSGKLEIKDNSYD